jgi:hypothetical protein
MFLFATWYQISFLNHHMPGFISEIVTYLSALADEVQEISPPVLI